MSCEALINAWRPANGGPLRFTRGMPADGKAYTQINVPCGNCILCREEQARQWAVRITHEQSLHLDNCFGTLTYADKHLPEHNSLHYPDLQKFWKRARKKLGPLRYYAVGEYGDRTLRPHYHFCVFGHAFTEGRVMLREQPNRLWTSPLLEELWGLGNVSIGTLNFETARYTASYVTKKLRSKQTYVRIEPETGELVPLIQPRAFMSLKPAIGRAWLDLYGKYVYEHDRVVIQGRPQKPPKYYDQWLGKIDKEKLEKIKEQRTELITESPTEQIRTAHARAEYARARARNKRKSI